ncbi:sulfide/dihydroorotate dehydrogenase-like FAD/NAD-binding protein [Balneolales bacterium ANBcel1]|nr:sulfide/dihydroorotate dehydrogenase-like FAD/NAD-binding protein [Balneolales bacterium ANBcel1]
MYVIQSRSLLAPGIAEFVVEAPLIAKKRKPGNFVIVRPTKTGERIPLTIVTSDAGQGTITLIVQAIGKTTRMMHQMGEGDAFEDVVGPLGEPTPVANYGRVVCIGGGVGTAVIYPMAKGLKDAGNEVISIIGAQKSDMVILEKEMGAVSDELLITTDDGSRGMKGFVTQALAGVMERGDQIHGIYATGPLPMMKAVADQTRASGTRTLVSLNPIMMDGTGMCGACRVTVGDSLKFACVDGPEFDAHAINFDELITRNRAYMKQESEALKSLESDQSCKAVRAL